MSAYNLKVVEYNGYLQFRVYSNPIFVEDEKTDIYEKNREDYYLRENGWKEDKKGTSKVKKSDDEKRAHSEKVSINRTIQTIYDYSLNNNWDWFVTLTFSDETVCDRNDYIETMSKVRKWCNHVKERKSKTFKYLLVPEKHKQGGYHVHALFANCGDMVFVDSVRVAIGKKAYKRTAKNSDHPWIYNIADWKYGWSSATKVQSSVRCASYITKYITKELCIELKNYRRFYPSNNLEKSIKTTYNLSYDEIDEWIRSYNVDYMKVQHIPEAGQTIKYITVTI